MSGRGTRHFRNTLTNDGLDFDKSWFLGIGTGTLESGRDRSQVVPILNPFNRKSISGKSVDHTLALAGIGHSIEGDIIGIVKDGQVIEGQGDRRGRQLPPLPLPASNHPQLGQILGG